MQFCCPLLLLFSLLFVIQIVFTPVNAGKRKDKAHNISQSTHDISQSIKITQQSMNELLQCLVNYDYEQKARSISELHKFRKELENHEDIIDPEKGGKQMDYFMKPHFNIEESVKHCLGNDNHLKLLITAAVSSHGHEFIGKGKTWLVKEFKEIKTNGLTYVNRGSPNGIFGTRSNAFKKALLFWRRLLAPYGLAVKGSILELAKILYGKLNKSPNQDARVKWQMKRIEDEFEADLLITKYTYHNYYVGDEDKFVPREEEVDKDGKKIYESIEEHEKHNLYFDRAYELHRENINKLMKNVEFEHEHKEAPISLKIPHTNRVIWVVRRLSAFKEERDLSDDQISLIKADLANAFEHIPISKIHIVLVKHENKKGDDERTIKFNAEGPAKAEKKNKEAENTALHIWGKRQGEININKIGPMEKKLQYIQGEQFAKGDDEDLPTVKEILMEIVTGKEQKKEHASVIGNDPMDIDEQPSSSHHGHATDASSPHLSPEEIDEIAKLRESEPKWNREDWLAPGEENPDVEHIVLVADLAAIMALHQLVDSKYRYAAPGCILKLVEVGEPKSKHHEAEGSAAGVSSDASKVVEGLEGLSGLRLISGGIYKHLGGLKHKGKAFFEKYFTN